jgi:hypothetical protein
VRAVVVKCLRQVARVSEVEEGKGTAEVVVLGRTVEVTVEESEGTNEVVASVELDTGVLVSLAEDLVRREVQSPMMSAARQRMTRAIVY